jgi:hypothetical protein
MQVASCLTIPPLSAFGRDVWSFRFDSDRWTEVWHTDSEAGISSGPNPRSGHTCVILSEEGASGERTADMLVFGGMSPSPATSTVHVVDELWRYSLREDSTGISGTWSQVLTSGGVRPTYRYDHTAVPYMSG